MPELEIILHHNQYIVAHLIKREVDVEEEASQDQLLEEMVCRGETGQRNLKLSARLGFHGFFGLLDH